MWGGAAGRPWIDLTSVTLMDFVQNRCFPVQDTRQQLTQQVTGERSGRITLTVVNPGDLTHLGLVSSSALLTSKCKKGGQRSAPR